MKLAFRQLAKSPGFTVVAVLTLALGIGAAAVVFTALDALLLRPLPFIQHQDRMLWLSEAIPAKNVAKTGISLADFLVWRARTRTLSALWLYDDRTAIITGRSQPLRRLASGVGAEAFPAMGVQPILGRTFSATDEAFGAPPVAILGYELWQSEFGGAREIVGQVITLNGRLTTIIGVMPQGWRYPERADLWMPFVINPAEARHGSFHTDGHAMLKPGVTLDEARAEFAGISAALAKEFPATNDGVVAVLRPLREEAAEDAQQLMVLLFGAVMFVFLIACANVANLLLVRGAARTKEIAIRLALGATRRQLVGHLLAESLVLALLGGAGGLILSFWGIDLMMAAIPIELPFWLRFELDPRVVSFVVGLSILACVVFGLVPAWQASRPDVIEEIKDSGRSATGGARGGRVRHALVVSEIALALVLLVGAGLMMRSFLALHRAPPGFDAQGVLTFRLGFPTSTTSDPALIRRFFADLASRLAALPGVESAAAISALPGIGSGGFHGILLEGDPEPSSVTESKTALYRMVTPGFFETLRIPLKAGRLFDPRDDEAHPKAAVVDERFAALHFPGRSPLGQRFRRHGATSGGKPDWVEIVGVVGNTRRHFDRDESNGSYYVPHAQRPTAFMTLAIRVHGEPTSYLAAARKEVLALNPDMPIFDEMPLTRSIARSEEVWLRRFFGTLFGAFAGVALLLALIGIYGVMAYAVAQRTHEIGVRMALGASPRDVLSLIARQGARLIALGLVIGLVAAYFLARLLAGNLYGISPHDAPTFALVLLLLAAIALLACLVPARRATKVDPMVALRAE